MTNNYDTIDDMHTVDGGGQEGKLLANRYKVLQKLGEGGMGMVYLAEDTELGNVKVALKFIPPMLAGNARAIKNLHREAQAAMRLSHPNIVRTHDLHTDGHQKFLVMEYIEGLTLEEALAEKDNDKLSLEELFPIAEKMPAGLDYAHSEGILHRDLKPSNIMIARDGRVKLLDFGIAREIKDSYTRVTGKETSGTLPYMSPQQLMGESPTRAMDIYSFGAILYECLSGHPPFHRGDIARQIETKQAETLSHVTGSVNSVLQASLSKDPKQRPPNANACVCGLGGEGTGDATTPDNPALRYQQDTTSEPSVSADKTVVRMCDAEKTRKAPAKSLWLLFLILYAAIPAAYYPILRMGLDTAYPVIPLATLVLLLVLTVVGPARSRSSAGVLLLPENRKPEVASCFSELADKYLADSSNDYETALTIVSQTNELFPEILSKNLREKLMDVSVTHMEDEKYEAANRVLAVRATSAKGKSKLPEWAPRRGD
jgi:serine/threonine protein kinase